jgi:hypothetical protein
MSRHGSATSGAGLEHASVRTYVYVALVLTAITALEVVALMTLTGAFLVFAR